MTQIKIVSNPYNRNLEYFIYKEQKDTWDNIKRDNINSKLRENDEKKIFLPFTIKKIVDTIVSEYYVGNNKIELIFEGTTDEYNEVFSVCNDDNFSHKVHLTRSRYILENARDILEDIKEIFGRVEPIISYIVKDDFSITKELVKVSDALKDIIPVCIFGDYSAGKSTFINAMLGHEIFPSGKDLVISKIYEIKHSKQDDRARIGFSYRGEEFELLFDNKECRVVIGDKEKDLIKEIFDGIAVMESPDLFRMTNRTITIINDYEKRDKTATLISNVIRIEIPFSKNGKLGQSRNEFVIFYTLGSNFDSNVEYSTVLAGALEGFSNGIPIWVSTYDNLDINDNANLCDKILSIEALDKRFTMIVVNCADQAGFEDGSLSDKQVAEILEYNSVEKMYASGIFFISSIMGLGAKLNGELTDEFYRETFRRQREAYLDIEDEYYTSLYKFNIMPEQIKNRAMKYSAQQSNLIYANSGLYCIEEEMEEFASKYFAYNKCQMVYMFLERTINEIGRRITEKEDIYNKNKEYLFLMYCKIIYGNNLLEQYKKKSENKITSFVAEFLDYEYTPEGLEEMKRDILLDVIIQNQIGNFDIDKVVSDRMKKRVVDTFMENINDAQDRIYNFVRKYWKGVRDELISRLEQNTKFSNIIRYSLKFDDEVYKEVRNSNSRSSFLSIKHCLDDLEKLDVNKLADIYNLKLEKNIKKIIKLINTSYFNRCKKWLINLLVNYDPKLRKIFEVIEEELEQLQNSHQLLTNSFEMIKNMMKWKDLA